MWATTVHGSSSTPLRGAKAAEKGTSAQTYRVFTDKPAGTMPLTKRINSQLPLYSQIRRVSGLTGKAMHYPRTAGSETTETSNEIVSLKKNIESEIEKTIQKVYNHSDEKTSFYMTLQLEAEMLKTIGIDTYEDDLKFIANYTTEENSENGCQLIQDFIKKVQRQTSLPPLFSELQNANQEEITALAQKLKKKSPAKDANQEEITALAQELKKRSPAKDANQEEITALAQKLKKKSPAKDANQEEITALAQKLKKKSPAKDANQEEITALAQEPKKESLVKTPLKRTATKAQLTQQLVIEKKQTGMINPSNLCWLITATNSLFNLFDQEPSLYKKLIYTNEKDAEAQKQLKKIIRKYKNIASECTKNGNAVPKEDIQSYSQQLVLALNKTEHFIHKEALDSLKKNAMGDAQEIMHGILKTLQNGREQFVASLDMKSVIRKLPITLSLKETCDKFGKPILQHPPSAVFLNLNSATHNNQTWLDACDKLLDEVTIPTYNDGMLVENKYKPISLHVNISSCHYININIDYINKKVTLNSDEQQTIYSITDNCTINNIFNQFKLSNTCRFSGIMYTIVPNTQVNISEKEHYNKFYKEEIQEAQRLMTILKNYTQIQSGDTKKAIRESRIEYVTNKEYAGNFGQLAKIAYYIINNVHIKNKDNEQELISILEKFIKQLNDFYNTHLQNFKYAIFHANADINNNKNTNTKKWYENQMKELKDYRHYTRRICNILSINYQKVLSDHDT